jgi:hypothetical protein
MRFTNFLPVLVFGVAAAIAQPSFAQEDNAKGSFRCGVDGSTPATLAKNGIKEVVLIRWTRDFSPGWNPQRRCNQVSTKFLENQSSGYLAYVVPGRANGYNVLCASKTQTSEVIDCSDAQILMTLREEDDPSEFIAKLVAANAEGSPTDLRHSAALQYKGNVYISHVRSWIRTSKPVNKSSVYIQPSQGNGKFW